MPPAAPATDFRPVILGGDITAYTLVRTFHEAYGVRPSRISTLVRGLARTEPTRRVA